MILIDYNGIAIGNIVTQKIGADENMIRHMILNSLRLHRVKHREKFGELVLCIDGSKNWRREIYPQYKYNRKDARKESKMDWSEVFRIMNMVKEELKDKHFDKLVEKTNNRFLGIVDVVETKYYKKALKNNNESIFFVFNKK